MGKNLSIPMARNAAIDAAKNWTQGQAEALSAFEKAFAETLKQSLRDVFAPDLLDSPRHWVAVSGLFYVARDLELTLETPVPLEEVLALIRSKIQGLRKAGDPSKLGS